MSGFEVRPAGDYPRPKYPAADAPRAPLIGNRRAAAWTLAAIVPLCTIAAVAPHPTTQQEAPRKAAPVSIQRLTDAEIEGLVDDLRVARRRADMVDGDVAAVSGVLTEGEATSVLFAFFKKNGLLPKLVNLGGVPVVLDATRGVGVVVLPEPGAARPLDRAIEELALLRARGESRVLLLDGREFEYDADGFQADRLPTKKDVVQRLLAELERILE